MTQFTAVRHRKIFCESLINFPLLFAVCDCVFVLNGEKIVSIFLQNGQKIGFSKENKEKFD
jgi:hypothetical protein